jgi:glucans biosynthesis protein
LSVSILLARSVSDEGLMTTGDHLQGRSKPVAGRGYWLLVLAIAFSCVAAATATRPAGDAKGTPRYRFDGNTVVDLARRTASSAFVQKRLDNATLQQLTYDQYRDIRFKTDASIWRN